jgi:hypothetical protein
MEDTFQCGKKTPIRRIMSDKTNVTVNLGYTLNLGNFQSLRVDLGCTDYVRESEGVDAAMERVYAFVESKVIEKIEEAKKEM